MIRYFIFTVLVLGFWPAMGQDNMLPDNKELEVIKNEYYSANNLKELKFLILESDYLIRFWAYNPGNPDTPEKIRLIDYHQNVIPRAITNLNGLAIEWEAEKLELFKKTSISIDTVLKRQNFLMGRLNGYDAYNDVLIQFECQGMISDKDEFRNITDRILKELDILGNYFAEDIEKSLFNR